jgi:glycosyltransferase involved in cell wall biosynthesis
MPLFRELRRELIGSDILHIHELRSTLSVFAYRAARQQRLPYVVSTHGGLRHLGRRSIKILFDAAWGARILREAAAIVAISPVEETDAKAFAVKPERIQKLPNMVSPSDYELLPPKGLFRSRWGLGSGKILLSLGRLHWIKGVDLLIRAFKNASRPHGDIQLVIAGPDDGQENELRTMSRKLGIDSAVTFTGFLDHQAKLEAFSDADALVIPSRSEVFAITAVEALACGCPVLVSDACGLYPMPGPEHGVLSFKSEDTRDLAAKLSQVIEDRSLRSMAQRGREFVISEFGAEQVSRRAESIYSNVIRGTA